MPTTLSALDNHRLYNLRRYVYTNGGPGVIAKKVGVTSSYLVQMIGPSPSRSVTERTVRAYEHALGLPTGHFDQPSTVFGVPIEESRKSIGMQIVGSVAYPSDGPPKARQVAAQPPAQVLYSMDEFKGVMAMVYNAYKDRVGDPSQVSADKLMRLVDMVFKSVKADHNGRLPASEELGKVVDEVVAIL